MGSILAVPEQSSARVVTVELKPAQAKERLAKLPLLHSEDTLSKIFHDLHDLNRIPVKPGTRLRLLELYRKPVKFIEGNIDKNLSGKYTPLSEKNGQIAELCRQVSVEMAYGYKSVVLDSANAFLTTRSSGDLPTAVHRSIRYLTHTIYNSATYYSSFPPGTWLEIHALFLYARKLGIQDKVVKDTLNRAKPKNSISHAYQHAVLFGISDPYKQSATVIRKIYRYLDRWASNVKITTYRSATTTRCHFVIDPSLDRPHQPDSTGNNPKRSKQLLQFDARAITKIAHNQWCKLGSGADPNSSTLGEGFFDNGGLDMLERVIQAWGLSPKRKHPRNAISGPYQMALGINACNFFLNGGSGFTGAATDEEEHIIDAASGTFGLQQVRKRDEVYVKQNWQGANESIHGLCLFVDLSRPAAVLVRVGEVIAFRTNRGDARWGAGLVRWVRATETELRIGIQRLGASCLAVAIKPASGEKTSTSVYKNSIAVPHNDNIEQAKSLLAPPGIYKKDRALMVDDGTNVKLVRATSLIERSLHFEWFEFEDVEENHS